MTHHVTNPARTGIPTVSSHGSAPSRRTKAGRLPGVLVACTVLPLVTLAGCASHSENNFTVGSVQSTYKTRHPIVIGEKDQTLDVPVASSSYKLPRPSASAVEGFAARYKASANGNMTVMVPSGSPNEAAAGILAASIVDTLKETGVSPQRIRMASYFAGEHGPSAPIRLSYGAVEASVEQCGQWTEDLAGPNKQNQNWHNYGCAYQNNLAAMIANPADLLGPRGMTPIDAQRRNTAIENYRDGDFPAGEDGSLTSTFGD